MQAHNRLRVAMLPVCFICWSLLIYIYAFNRMFIVTRGGMHYNSKFAGQPAHAEAIPWFIKVN